MSQVEVSTCQRYTNIGLEALGQAKGGKHSQNILYMYLELSELFYCLVTFTACFNLCSLEYRCGMMGLKNVISLTVSHIVGIDEILKRFCTYIK